MYNGFYDSSKGVIPGWIQPPVLPILIGIFSIIFSIHYAGYIVGFCCAVLLLILLFRFLYEHFDTPVSYVAVLFLAINPLFVTTNLRVLAEPVYTCINFILFTLMYRLFVNKEKASIKNVIWLSVLSVLLYLSRSEGIFYIVLVMILLMAVRKIKMSFVYLSLTFLLLLPYGLFTQQKCGSFRLFPKITYSIRAGLIGRLIQDEVPVDSEKKEEYVRKIWFAYDEKNKTTFGTNLLEDASYSELQSRINTQKSSLSADKLKLIVYQILNNAIEMGRVFFRSYIFPLLYLIIFIIGFMAVFRKNRRLFYFLLLWMIPAFYFILSHVEDRFFYVLLPPLVIFMSLGFTWLIKRFNLKMGIVAVIFLLVLTNSFFYYAQFYRFQAVNNTYYSMSESLKNDIEEKSLICMKPFYLTFFGNYDYLKLPICYPNQLVEYMGSNEAKYLILGEEIESTHQILSSIYKGQVPEFKILRSIEMENRTYKLFQLH